VKRSTAALALAAALVGLHAIGTGPLAAPPLTAGGEALVAWWRARPPDDVVMAVIRLVTMGAAAYLLLVVVLDLLATVTGSVVLHRVVTFVALPLVRHAIAGGTGALLLLNSVALVSPSSASSPAPGSGTPPVLVGLPTTRPVRTEASPPPTTRPPTTRPPTTRAPSTPTPSRPPVTTPTRWLVRRGDSMWRIAQSTLAEHLGREVTAAEIGPWWLELIAANGGAFRYDNDPGLIYPGQVFDIPPLQQPD
jgi:hypothetical protein